MSFRNRKEAGIQLGNILAGEYRQHQTVVFGLPRGGVVAAKEVAKKLNAPLFIVFSRKIGHPFEPEYAIAAISEFGHFVSNPQTVEKVDKDWLSDEIARQKKEIARRKALYHVGSLQSLRGKTAIIVDDGIATGLTMRAAIVDIMDLQPAKVIIAVPVAPQDVVDQLKKEVDTVVVLQSDKQFLGSVGAYYEDFPQVTDEEVIKMLQK